MTLHCSISTGSVFLFLQFTKSTYAKMTQTQTAKAKPRKNVWQILRIWHGIARFHVTSVRRKEVSKIRRGSGTNVRSAMLPKKTAN